MIPDRHEQVEVAEKDADVLRETADCAIHWARHGKLRTGFAYMSVAFTYGPEAVSIMCERLAIRAIHSMWQMPGMSGVTAPMWPLRSGGIVVDAWRLAPPARWAGRYIAACADSDYALAADLIEACDTHQLSCGIEALLQITAAWIDLAEGTCR